MKAGQRTWWSMVGAVVAVGLVAGACGGGAADDEAGVVRPSTTAAPGREEPTTSVAPPLSSPSTTPTTDARPDPVYVDGVPQVTVTPSRAPAGAVVRLEGYGFTGDPWQTGGGQLWLSEAGPGRPDDCTVFAEADHDITVTADGHLSGTFVVPAKGECRFSTGEVDTGPLRYDIAYQCTACHIGTFTVILAGETAEEPTGTSCGGPINFGVQNFADEIYADGLSCAEAESFLQDHARPLQPPDGAAHIDAEGFSCDRTGLSADALPPRANYTCTRDAQTIHFVRQ